MAINDLYGSFWENANQEGKWHVLYTFCRRQKTTAKRQGDCTVPATGLSQNHRASGE